MEQNLNQHPKFNYFNSHYSFSSNFFRKNKDYFFIWLVFLLYACLLTPFGDYKHPLRNHEGYYSIQKIDPSDDAGYYSFVRSGIIDGDFDFFNEKRYWHFDRIMPTGYSINYWPFGQSFIWMPFFLIGHLLAFFYSFLGYPIAADGYSFPYHSLTFIASSCEAFFALIICYKLLENFFSRRICLTSTILVFTATSLPYFTFIRNRMSHSGDVLVCFLFFLLYILFQQNKNRPYSFFVFWGAFAGLLMDFRYTHIAYLFIPFTVLMETFLPGAMDIALRKKIRFGIFLGSIAFALMVMPQLTIWKKLHGTFSPMNIMQVIVEPTFSSVLNSIGNLFFGTTWGFAFTEPLWLFGFLGLILFVSKDLRLGGICLVIFLAFCVTPVVLGNGNSFGQRYMLSAMPVLALGLGKFIDTAQKKLPFFVIAAFGALMSIWVYILLLNYKIILWYDAQEFALRSFQNIPQIFGKMAFFRPTTYIDLIFKGHFQLRDFIDYFFLLIFPLSIAGTSFFLLCLFIKAKERMENNKDPHVSFFKNISAVLLIFAVILTLFVLLKHPELSEQKRKERLQIASASIFLKEFPDLKKFQTTILRAKTLDTEDELAYRIVADAYFIAESYNEATSYYLKAIEVNENSNAWLQLDRIKVLTGQKKLSEPLLKEELKKGDPTGEINRWIGIYYLDKLKQPEKCIHHFNLSLNSNPEQKQAKALKNVISQYFQQRHWLLNRKIAPKSLPPIYYHDLNTYINFVRLKYFSLDQPF